jgi:hypothetical protein
METKRKQRAEMRAQKQGACLTQLLDELKAYA